MAMLYLCKQGFGSLADIVNWDTETFLDALEYEAISNAISRHLMWKSEQGVK